MFCTGGEKLRDSMNTEGNEYKTWKRAFEAKGQYLLMKKMALNCPLIFSDWKLEEGFF